MELWHCEITVVNCGGALRSLERETGIEPAPSAWKAEVLPLNYSRAGGTRMTIAGDTLKLVEGGGFEPPKA